MVENPSSVLQWLATELDWERRMNEFHARREHTAIPSGGCGPPLGGCPAGRPPSGSEHDRATAPAIVVG